MSSPEIFWLLGVAVGHVALFVYLVNVSHAFGSPERVMSWVKLGLLGWLLVGGAWLARQAFQAPLVTWPLVPLTYAGLCLVVGVALFPVFTLWHHFRARPKAIERRSSAVDLAAEHGLENLVGEGRYARLLRLPGNESLTLRRTEWEITLPGLPQGLDGLTVLQISDLHFAPCFRREFFEAVLASAASWEADLVLFTGDLIDHDSALDWVEPLFQGVKGRFGSYAILGNHDYEHQPEELLGRLEAAGYETLEARWAALDVRGTRLALAGTSYPWGRLPDMRERPEADFSILLSHCPDQFDWAERKGFGLMLSGHNHGGQIRLPLVGPVFMPSRFSRKFDRGFFRKRGLTLHVCQGVAGKHPVRFGGCVPELNRLTLRAMPVGTGMRPARTRAGRGWLSPAGDEPAR